MTTPRPRILSKLSLPIALRGVKNTLRDLPTDIYSSQGTDRYPEPTDIITMRAQLQDYEQVLAELQELQVEAERALKFLGEVWQRQVDRGSARMGVTHSILTYRTLFPDAKFDPPPGWDDENERDLIANTTFDLSRKSGPTKVSPSPLTAAQQSLLQRSRSRSRGAGMPVQQPGKTLTPEEVERLSRQLAGTTMTNPPAQIPKTGIGPGGAASNRRPHRADP